MRPRKTSSETTNDLFELSDYVSRAESQEFQDKRGEWLKKFDTVLQDLFERRLGAADVQTRNVHA